MFNESEEYPPNFNVEFDAQVLAVTVPGDGKGQNLYTWQEQTWDSATSVFYPLPGGRNGGLRSDGTIQNPAVEINNSLLTKFPLYVKMRLRGQAGGTLFFEFLAPPDSTGTTVTLTIVTNVCPIVLP